MTGASLQALTPTPSIQGIEFFGKMMIVPYQNDKVQVT